MPTFKPATSRYSAYQVTADRLEHREEWPFWLRDAMSKPRRTPNAVVQADAADDRGHRPLRIFTDEGCINVPVGDWIVRDPGGNLFPVPPELFKRLFI